MTGSEWETLIALMIQDHVNAGELIAWKFPTPYSVLEARKEGRFLGVWRTSIVDFVGCISPDGRFVGIEAKHVEDGKLSVLYGKGNRGKSQKGSGLKRHQLNVLANIARTGGIAIVLVHDSQNDQTVCLPVDSSGQIGPFERGSKTLDLERIDAQFLLKDTLLSALKSHGGYA